VLLLPVILTAQDDTTKVDTEQIDSSKVDKPAIDSLQSDRAKIDSLKLEKIDLSFDDKTVKESFRKYFVLVGGLTVDWLLISDTGLNSFLANTPDELKLSGPIHLTGGQGLTGVPWVKNLRLGVLGYGGSLESEVLGDTQLTQTKLSVSMFGFSVHYAYVPFEHLAVLAGVNAGWGDMIYEKYEGQATKETTFSGNGTNRLQKNYFFVMPNVELEYAVANFIILRLDASYNMTLGQDTDWTYNKVTTNTVNPDFNLSGLKIGFGVMVGLVNF
jgi:hypothetical protein